MGRSANGMADSLAKQGADKNADLNCIHFVFCIGRCLLFGFACCRCFVIFLGFFNKIYLFPIHNKIK